MVLIAMVMSAAEILWRPQPIPKHEFRECAKRANRLRQPKALGEGNWRPGRHRLQMF